jgi:hypothetical protein
MVRTEAFVKYLLSNTPQSNAARLSLYHYLKNLTPLQDALRPEVFFEFFSVALTHGFWRKNRELLSEEVLLRLEDFSKNEDLGFSLNKIKWARDLQILKIERKSELKLVLERYLQEFLPKDCDVRILPLASGKTIALVVDPHNKLTVHQFDSWVIVDQGRLLPLKRNLSLRYNQSLEIADKYPQMLAAEPNSIFRFFHQQGLITGYLVRGYTFQKALPFTKQPVNKAPELFYALKSLERHYIDLRSDPFYQEVIDLLENSCRLLQINHPNSENLAKLALEKGLHALKNVFPDDKVLLLLVKDLARLVKAPQPKDDLWELPQLNLLDSTSISPNAE